MWEKLASSVRAHPYLWGWSANFLFCTTVGVAMATAFEDRVASYLLVSYSIGFSVHICIHWGIRLLAPSVNLHFVVVLMTIVGIVVGFVIGGSIVAGRPLLLLQDNSSPLAFALLFGVLGVIGFRLIFELWAARGELEQAERDALVRGKALAEAELRVLQAQMEPHFLFNTLSNVISLIQTDPSRAARLLEQLTIVLRAALNRTRAPDATLGDELELVRAYLDIQAQRMDGRLRHQRIGDSGNRKAEPSAAPGAAACGKRYSAWRRAVRRRRCGSGVCGKGRGSSRNQDSRRRSWTRGRQFRSCRRMHRQRSRASPQRIRRRRELGVDRIVRRRRVRRDPDSGK